MPLIVGGSNTTAGSTISPDDWDRMRYVDDHCPIGLSGDDLSSCLKTYGGLWDLRENAIFWGPVLIGVLVVAFLVYSHRADIENAFADVKNRIADKANE